MPTPTNREKEKRKPMAPRRKSTLTVKRLAVDGHQRRLGLSNDENVWVHRFACVGKNDRIKFEGSGDKRAIVVLCTNGEVRLNPAFSYTTSLKGLKIRLQVKEVENQEELDAFERLSSYHYRNNISFGRRAILIARIPSTHGYKIVGYIEITNSFAGHFSRNKLLDAPFSDGNGISWESWNVEAKKKYLNTIARISRCVVHPEYRGMGIGVALCKGARKFCETKWQMAGYKPLFLEITADMLKFVPFPEKAGMHYIGKTTGNLARLLKDQRYLQSVEAELKSGRRKEGSHSVFAEDAKSILKRQRRDVADLRKIADQHELDVLTLLEAYVTAEHPEELSPVAYDILHQLVRFPKPTYLVGLTPAANAFVRSRLTEQKVAPDIERIGIEIEQIPVPITVKDLTIDYSIVVPSADWSNALQEAFGIHKESISSTGVRALSADILPGQVFYIWGPSGSGKTVLLEAIKGDVRPSTGNVKLPKGAKAQMLELEFEDQPVICEVGISNLADSLFVLGLVGLAEANLYFKHPDHLSAGQRYRLAIAKLMLSKAPIWLIDEFCSILDDNTAQLIAWNIGRFARQFGATAIIAGPRREPVISALKPDQILNLDSLGEWHFESVT